MNMTISSRVARARARIAATLRHDPQADVTGLRAELKASVLADQIVAAAPILTPTQRADLAALLRPVGGDA